MGLPRTENWDLFSQIHHVFLPPRLPEHSSSDVFDGRALLETVCDELLRFRSYFDDDGGVDIDRCIRSFGCLLRPFMETDKEQAEAEMDALAQQMVELKDNDFLVMHLENQNAGLLVTREDSEMRFEALELLTPDDTVMGCGGRVRRCFPTREATVPRSVVLDVTFQQPFFKVLAHLSRYMSTTPFLHGGESRSPKYPKLLMEMVMSVLGGVGRCETPDIPRIRKNCREEVLFREREEDKKKKTYSPYGSSGPRKDPRDFWRRSPLWLLVRVTLQLKLDRSHEGHDQQRPGATGMRRESLYKAFMIFFMSSILERAATTHVPHDLLCFMNAKIKRRALKLGASEGEAWYSFPSEVSQRVDSVLARHWAALQSPEKQELYFGGFATLDPEQDTVLSLETLRPYLAWASVRDEPRPRDDRLRGFPFRRTKQDEHPPEAFRPDRDIAFFELADFERWVESDAERFLSRSSERQIQERGATPCSRVLGGELKLRPNATAGTKAQPAKCVFGLGGEKSQWDSLSRDGDWSSDTSNGIFAQDVWANIGVINPEDPLLRPAASRYCDTCSALPFLRVDFELLVSPGRLGKSSEQCDLCAMLYRALWPVGAVIPVWPVRLHRKKANLMLEGNQRPVLRMCGGPGWKGGGGVSVGLPRLLERPSPAHFRLIARWLEECDNSHERWGCHAESEAPPQMPSRVLDVGDAEDSFHVRLICTEQMRGRYVALSHRWGEQTDELRQKNCTVRSNFAERCRGIDPTTLGRTFQDAITTTRALGLRYLWIDSLCILQGDSDDWKQEAGRMEGVFDSAYCVIAATAAMGTDDGFLQRSVLQRGCTAVSETSAGGSGEPLYFCQAVDDFAGDVEDAGLNRRGWVLQERVLARRTVHFSASQTYMECGYGIRCESLNLLTNAKRNFLGDPQFPKRVLSEMAAHEVFQSTFKTYSRLELTQPSDRSVAIAGIERRLASALQCPVAFGVFGSGTHLHRSLLWRRAGRTLLRRIDDDSDHVPTWSWTAFDGPIDYLALPDAPTTEWDPSISLHLPGEGRPVDLSVPVLELVTEHIMRDSDCLILDCQRTIDVRTLRCVVVAKQSPPKSNQGADEIYHILVVVPTQAVEPHHQYKRVGIASVRKEHVALQLGSVQARLV